MSAEDLTIQAGLALQPDLAVASLLGITHVERNGHHYVNGMAPLSLQGPGYASSAVPDWGAMRVMPARDWSPADAPAT